MAESQDNHRRLWEEVSSHHIAFDMLEEMHQRMLELARESGWSQEETPLTIFAYGLEYLRAERVLSRLNGESDEAKTADELQRTVAQLLDESSKYAVMKFRAWSLSQDNQVLKMHEAGLRGELMMAKECLKAFRKDEEDLRQKILQLEEENNRLRALLPEKDSGTTQERDRTKSSLLRRLKWWQQR